jgi:hypothetical protein
MTDFTFLFNRKGALYPIDYENLNEWPHNNNHNPTLVQLCCKVIVSDAILTHKIVGLVPNELFMPLFKAALYPVRDLAIDVSISLSLSLALSLFNISNSLIILKGTY